MKVVDSAVSFMRFISLIFIKKSWKSWEDTAISIIFAKKDGKARENSGFGSFIAK